MTAAYKINDVTHASVVSACRRQAVCRCDILAQRDGLEYLCAIAQGTSVRRSESSQG